MSTNAKDTEASAEAQLNSRAVLFFTGCSYLCVGLSFSYLDRHRDYFNGESAFWLVWTLLGFGAALIYHGRSSRAAQTHWKLMVTAALLFSLFPGFFKYNLLRWTCLTLLLVLPALSVVLRTRRDFYLVLTVIFVVSLMVATYFTADWTVWFYLAPAWLLAALALAWEYAAGTALSRWAKSGLTLAFIALSFLLTLMLFIWAPRPDVLGFGFLPPGTDTPNLKAQAAGGQGGSQGNDGRDGASGAGQQTGGSNAWQQMFDRMRRDLDDRHIPDWQRQTLQRLTGWGEILAAALTGQIVAGLGMPSARTMEELLREAGEYCVEKIILPWWPILLLLLLLLWLIARLWPRRYGLGVAGLLFGAHVLVRWRPMLSMRLSARALNWCLRQQGHEPVGGQSVREHLAGASSVPDLPRRWLGYAVDLYCETRFGSMAATRQRAANMHKVIHAASQILAGVMPELMRG